MHMRRQTTLDLASELLPSPLSAGNNPLLYLWSMEKFIQRLDVMREIFADGDGTDFSEIRKLLRSKPWQNPWREMSFADVRQQIEFYSKVEKSDERVNDQGSIDLTHAPRESSKDMHPRKQNLGRIARSESPDTLPPSSPQVRSSSPRTM